MGAMGRPRHDGKKDLPLGLYLYPGRNAYIKMAGWKSGVGLGTRDRKEALAIYWEFRRVYDAEQQQQHAEALVAELTTAARGGGVVTVAQYARKWREERLPTFVSKRTRKSLAPKTLSDYARILEHQVEAWAPFQEIAIAGATVKHVRACLARWIGSPNYYNYVMAVLSLLFQDAVAEGLLDTNPVAGVERRATAKRKVVCPMDHYLVITKHLPDWQARACDLIYLISHRPGDVLRLEDRAPGIRYEARRGRQVVVVSLLPTKNEQAIEIVEPLGIEGGIEATLVWFRQWKKTHALAGANLVVFPPGFRRRDVGRPVPVGYLSRRFAEACAAAGFAGKYQLRDLRKTGLNEEARRAGKATNKGGHKTRQMQEYYVVDGIPQRARSTLTVLRGQT